MGPMTNNTTTTETPETLRWGPYWVRYPEFDTVEFGDATSTIGDMDAEDAPDPEGLVEQMARDDGYCPRCVLEAGTLTRTIRPDDGTWANVVLCPVNECRWTEDDKPVSIR